MHNKTLAGRYIRFAVFAGTSYTFNDELEVYSGTFDPGTVTPDPCQLVEGTDDFEAWLYSNKYTYIAKIRMLYDLDDLSHHAQAPGFASQLASLESQVLAMPWISTLDFEAGLPYNTLEADIWSLNGQMQIAAGASTYAIARANLYDMIHPFDDLTPDSNPLTIDAAINETRAAALNITNYSTSAKTFAIDLAWNGTSLNSAISLRQIRYTEAQERWIVGSAMPTVTPDSPGHWTITLPAGAIGQILFSLDSDSLTPGDYEAVISVTPAGSSAMTQDLEITIHHGELPDTPSVVTAIWDYLNMPGAYPVTNTNNQGPTMQLHRQWRINAAWATNAVVFTDAGGSWKANGTYNWYPAFNGLRDWLMDLYNNSPTWPLDRYYIFLNSGYGSSFQGFTYDGNSDGIPDTAWKNAVKSFCEAVSYTFTDYGIPTENIALLVMDEPPHGLPSDKICGDFITTAKPHLANLGLNTKFFVDPTSISSVAQITPELEVILQNCGVVMPNAPRLRNYPDYRNWYITNVVNDPTQELGIYEATDGGRRRSPTVYWRRLYWECQAWGGESVGFWTGSGIRTSYWDDFGSCANYELPFVGATSATPGKMMMAVRDGSQDYEYFQILEDAIDAATTAGVPSYLIDNAQAVLDDTPQDALDTLSGASYSWGSGAFNAAFDDARIDVLEAIDLLDVAINGAASCVELWNLGLGNPADVNQDCQINAADLGVMADQWLGAGSADIAPATPDGIVNLLDFAVIAADWMTCYDPVTANCP